MILPRNYQRQHRSLTVFCLALILPALHGCGDATPPPEPAPLGPRSNGPQVDLEKMREDPIVRGFESECEAYRATRAELQPLDEALGAGTLSEEDIERWNALQAAASSERSRLNAIMYDDRMSEDQRAAMWWILQGKTVSGG